jgi:hypothetical protein
MEGSGQLHAQVTLHLPILVERAPGIQWVEEMGPTASQDALAERQISCPNRNQISLHVQPVAMSLYRLC